MKDARQAGCQVITGVEMFIRQAAYQYKLFTGKAPDVELMRKNTESRNFTSELLIVNCFNRSVNT